MKANRNERIQNLKIYITDNIKNTKCQTSKTKNDSLQKNNYCTDEEDKIISEDTNNNTISNKYENLPKTNYNFNYDYNSDNETNTLFKTASKTDEKSGEKKKSRKMLIKTSSYVSHKHIRNKISLSKKKIKKLSLPSLNYISNKRKFNNKVNKNDENEKINSLSINSLNKKSKSKLSYFKENQKRKINNLTKKKSYIIFTDNNYKIQNIKLYKNLLSKCFTSRNAKNNNNKISSGCNSYDDSLRFLTKSDNKNDKNEINKSNQKTNEIYKYIKVNKKDINQNKTLDISESINSIINSCNNISPDNKKEIQKVIIHKNNSQKIIKNDYNITDKNEKNGLMNIFGINKSENNIFLDKNYQNRFKQKTKNNKNKNDKNDIFTIEKQREYNTIIVKKKSNFIYNRITISTTNSSNSSSNKKNNYNIKKDDKNWVHRLYDQEIKKQKMKDKLVFLLRKSILNEKTPNKSKKAIIKSNKTKEFRYHNFNFDKNFNVIDLFLSDDKKKKIKFKKIGYKKESYNENDKLEDQNNNKERKSDKLIVGRKRNKSKNNKKFLFLYNEELIHEEDEEKEKDEDE